MQQTSLKSNTLTTPRFEQRIAQIRDDIQRYRKVEQSAELKEYKDLQQVVETPEFQKNKNYLLRRKYRDTEEYATMARYRQLKVAPRVHAYYLLRTLPNFKEYLVFAQSDRYLMLNDKDAVRQSAELRKYKFIDRSRTLRTYRRYEKSKEVRDYLQLRLAVKEEEFVERHAFWANPQRWYTTEESKQDARYEALKGSADIQFYLAQDPKQIAAWEHYQPLYEEEFNLANIEQTAWRAGFHYNNPNLLTQHSYADEQQAYNHGKNTHIADSALCIETRKEAATASAWHATKGFIPQDYKWTSDVAQTAAAFRSGEGLFMAKVRVSGKAHAAVYLASGERLPVVKLMQWDGRQVCVGMRTGKDTKEVAVSGIRSGQWMVYAVRINAKEIIWYVNDQEVLRAANTLQGALLYPAVAEYIPENATAATGKIQVDWVRVYKD